MKNKTVLITGSTDGIGKQTAIELALLGFNVIVHGRSEARVNQTVIEYKWRLGGQRVCQRTFFFEQCSQFGCGNKIKIRAIGCSN
jgi:NAD(P)-dependent dehydrogenase (short-subunit alcohol dehydrogenase family)